MNKIMEEYLKIDNKKEGQMIYCPYIPITENQSGQSANEPNNQPATIGKSLQQMRKFVNKLVVDTTKGFHSDTNWNPIHNFFKELRNNNIDYNIHNTKYGFSMNGSNKENPPSYKDWIVSIDFEDDKKKKRTITGTITAHGAGSVSDPLSKYDVTGLFY